MSLPDITILLPESKDFEAAWSGSGLAKISADALRDKSSYDPVPEAEQFLKQLHDASRETAFAGLARALGPCIDGTTAACFGHDYSLFREALFRPDRDSFDRLYGLFLPHTKPEDHTDGYDPIKLRRLGIWALYAPERSGVLTKLARIYSMSTFLGLLAEQGKELPEKVACRLGELADLENIHWQDMLVRYEQLTVLWAGAIRFASSGRRLLVAYVE